MKRSHIFSVVLASAVYLSFSISFARSVCEPPRVNGAASEKQTETIKSIQNECNGASKDSAFLNAAVPEGSGMVDRYRRVGKQMDNNIATLKTRLDSVKKYAGVKVASKSKEPKVAGNALEEQATEPSVETPRNKNCALENPDDPAQLAWQKACDAYVNDVISKLENNIESAISYSVQAKAAMRKAMMITGGAVAIGAGAMIYDDHKDDKKKKKAQQEYDLGIIKQADGKKIDCITASNYMSLDCRATLTRVCQEDEPKNPNTPNACRSFNAQYCAGEGSDTNYCLMQTAKAYCGTNTSSPSPACQWNAKRDASCKADPEKGSCLFSGTSDALKLQCGKYPNDPLCLAHANGRIVVAGGNAAAETDGSSTTYSDIVGETSSSSTSSDDLLPPNANLWASGSVQIQQNCAAGNLAGCQ